ncbi:MAG: hypothetical protein F2839_00430 [Actinobacteria bacterium]|uniref:Unannotated protein n=1 Tax=freshwater metagenome TaxID=449393 RepID=A0A6J5YIA3_9ZZZZ|nr:hypothetical protein [Actinomycetota bacterium]
MIPEELKARVNLTISCRDTDVIPKVKNAGEIASINGVEVQVMHNGIHVVKDGYLGSWTTEIIRQLQGHHEPQEEIVFYEILKRINETNHAQSVCIELGSFWAYYSMWYLKEIKNSQAIMIEPDPAYMQVGKLNFDLNNMMGTFIHGVIGDSPGQLMDFQTESSGVQRNIRQYSLWELLEISQQSSIDLLMCDIQGAEEFIIRTEREFFSSGKVRFALISTHHHSISGNAMTHWDVLDALVSMGGHIICEHSISESYSGDGLIAVSFDERDKDFTMELSRARQNESVFPLIERELREAQWQLKRANSRVKKMESSYSWRLTAPIRHLVRLSKKKKLK